MKIFINISRSIITSLLFLLTVLAILVHFVFTGLKINARDIEALLDREIILNHIDEVEAPSESIRNLGIEYIDNYIKYIFHKKSYPSFQSIDFENLNGDEKRDAENYLTAIKDKIDIEYESVLKLRSTNNFISNSSIFLLVNIAIFVLYILLVIIKTDFLKGTKLLSLALLASGLTAFLAVMFIDLEALLKGNIYNLFVGVDFNSLKKALSNLSLIYIAIGIVVLVVIYLFEHFYKMRQNRKI